MRQARLLKMVTVVEERLMERRECEPMLSDAERERRKLANEFYSGLIQMANAWRKLELPEIEPCARCGK